jgi:hypothetical protein
MSGSWKGRIGKFMCSGNACQQHQGLAIGKEKKKKADWLNQSSIWQQKYAGVKKASLI